MSLGAEALRSIVAKLGGREVARRVGVSEGTLRHILGHGGKPRGLTRGRFADLFGIAPEAWDPSTAAGPLARHYPDSVALCRAVLSRSDTVLLSFSCGKDSLAAWLRLREAGFRRIVPFYLWLVPELEFVEDGIRKYEKFFGETILRLPHPSFPRLMRSLTFQSPERAEVIEQQRWPNLKYEQVEDHVRAVAKVSRETYVAVWTRAVDSPIRLANIRQNGSLNAKRRSFLPVYDWRITDVRKAISAAG